VPAPGFRDKTHMQVTWRFSRAKFDRVAGFFVGAPAELIPSSSINSSAHPAIILGRGASAA
jgi:hypothetical protein